MLKKSSLVYYHHSFINVLTPRKEERENPREKNKKTILLKMNKFSFVENSLMFFSLPHKCMETLAWSTGTPKLNTY